MKVWHIEYWCTDTGRSPIEKWLDSLTKEQFKSVAKELMMLERAGKDLKLPHSKSLGKGLLELRERRFGYRVYYAFVRDTIIVLLAAGDKKTQQRDISIAYKRMLEFRED